MSGLRERVAAFRVAVDVLVVAGDEESAARHATERIMDSPFVVSAEADAYPGPAEFFDAVDFPADFPAALTEDSA